jgi:hypothetical protein
MPYYDQMVHHIDTRGLAQIPNTDPPALVSNALVVTSLLGPLEMALSAKPHHYGQRRNDVFSWCASDPEPTSKPARGARHVPNTSYEHCNEWNAHWVRLGAPELVKQLPQLKYPSPAEVVRVRQLAEQIDALVKTRVPNALAQEAFARAHARDPEVLKRLYKTASVTVSHPDSLRLGAELQVFFEEYQRLTGIDARSIYALYRQLGDALVYPLTQYEAQQIWEFHYQRKRLRVTQTEAVQTVRKLYQTFARACDQLRVSERVMVAHVTLGHTSTPEFAAAKETFKQQLRAHAKSLVRLTVALEDAYLRFGYPPLPGRSLEDRAKELHATPPSPVVGPAAGALAAA